MEQLSRAAKEKIGGQFQSRVFLERHSAVWPKDSLHTHLQWYLSMLKKMFIVLQSEDAL